MTCECAAGSCRCTELREAAQPAPQTVAIEVLTGLIHEKVEIRRQLDDEIEYLRRARAAVQRRM